MRWRAAVVSAAMLLGLSGVAGCGGGSPAAPAIGDLQLHGLKANLTPQAVSCLSATFCVAIASFNDASDPTDADNGAVGAYQWNGTTWSSPVEVIPASVQAGNHEVEPSISCSSTTRCVVVANDDATARFPTYSWDGRAWAAGPTLDDPGVVPVDTYVTCSGPSFCLASDGQATWIDSSGTWNKVTVNADTFACTSVTYCIGASGSDLPTEMWNGTAWQTAGAGPPLLPQVLACARPTLCVAAGHGSGATNQGRYAAVWSGSGWSPQADAIAPTSGGDITEASCPLSSSTCYTLDENADLLTYTDGRWSRRTVKIGAAITDLSCPTVTFCAVTDEIGGLITFRP